MKKYMIWIVVSILLFCLVGCGKTEQNELTVYSFCGENDFISISNGVIVLDSSKEICYGGDLEVKGDEFTDIVEYTTTIYLENSKYILMSNCVEDKSGGTISVSGDVGKISGDIFRDTDIEKITENLWFKLETIDFNGEKNIYQLQLELIEITGNY